MQAGKNTFQITDDTPIAALSVGQFKELCQSLGLSVHQSEPPQSNVMNIGEVAKLTGYSPKTLYKLTHTHQIPFFKPAHGGRMLFFNREEITDWMQGRRVKTTEEYCNDHIYSLKNRKL